MVTQSDIDKEYERIKRDAESAGYHLNPDIEFTRGLIRGLLVNHARYGYESCPCRLSMGSEEEDLDIICPCDYRDQDVVEFGSCYCALYVSLQVIDGSQSIQSIPERRPPRQQRKKDSAVKKSVDLSALPFPVWRCKVCGYLCARDGPPEACPICKARKDRFERFI
jgi:ferredoxin-thioredoxin reductase catalytic subunit